MLVYILLAYIKKGDKKTEEKQPPAPKSTKTPKKRRKIHPQKIALTREIKPLTQGAPKKTECGVMPKTFATHKSTYLYLATTRVHGTLAVE